ncbi:unnamed protein product [Linum trigynum]|uniref:Bifunctional inhibitor/plant lipid transfer protein/seed storage helical domain-containing protein n=1 Tax=Linum trigynum TaxID=586398 RepID=A0AAV2FEG1_9ROSI
MATIFHLLVVTTVVCLVTPTVMCKHNKDCSIQEMDLAPCFRLSNVPFSIEDSCCKVLNKAVKSGFDCLCLLLGSSTPPLLASALSLKLSNCLIKVPSLNHCGAVVPFQANRSTETPHRKLPRPFFLPPSPPPDNGRRNSTTEPPPSEEPPSAISNRLMTANEAGSIKKSLHQILLLFFAFQAYHLLLNRV